jgi:phosphate acetyltransferase
MAKSLYVSGVEPHSGKVLVSLGIMTMLERRIGRVGFFRPVAAPERLVGTGGTVPDRVVHVMREVFKLDRDPAEMYGVTSQEAEALLAAGDEGAVLQKILEAFKRLEEKVDFVLCEGTDFLSATSSTELDFNVAIARDLNTPVVLVVGGHVDDAETVHSKARLGQDRFREKGCELLATIINKADRARPRRAWDELCVRLRDAGVKIASFIPHEPALGMPRMDEVVAQINGRVLFGAGHLHNKVGKTMIASGSVATMIPLLENHQLLVTHTDRHDAVLMAILSLMSHAAPNIGGIILTGEHELAPPVMDLLQGLPGPRIPIVRSPQNTFETVLALTRVRTSLEPGHQRELEIARQLFESHVDTEQLAQAIQLSTPRLMTPKLFKYQLIQRARSDKRHIVLPEGGDDRVLKAADALLRLQAVSITLLGKPDAIRARAGQLGVDLEKAAVIDPQESDWHREFGAILQKLRAHKGVTLEGAREHTLDPSVFGTMMVRTGRADGMVAGATSSTARAIRPALQILRTRVDVRLISSVLFMCLEDRVLVYADCAVNAHPSVEDLAQIAISSADTARTFGIEPVVAMLSSSHSDEGTEADLVKVREAVRIARRDRPDLDLEGPLQYDAAVDGPVAGAPLPESRVGGRATVFVFPDLNTGNNTAMAVQRTARAVVIGPVLQGLFKPVNDLSRGSTVEDIIHMAAITAIQARPQD